ncbi:MAG: nucleotidyltransferase family protein [Verrucomicrobia bacterium]|nr:nucleotidyltransferase family protein [Verrucomicrobiota bacterium]
MNPPASPAFPAELHRPSSEPTVLRCGVVILAGGASTRMGSPKQLLEFQGQPLIVRVAEAALAAPVWPIVVVLGAHADRIRPTLAHLPLLVTENAAWAEGMASSIREGISTLQQFSRRLDAALIALCDQPAFSAEAVRKILATQVASGRSIVAARYAGRPGAPALFLRTHFAALASLTGEEGARTLLNAGSDHVATVDLPALAMDLDTPADLAAAQLAR